MKKNENAHSVSSLLIDINTKCQYGNSEKNDRGSKGWRSGESNRPPVLWPGLQILASTRYVSGSLPCSKTYSFCRFSDFPLSLKTDTQHSIWKQGHVWTSFKQRQSVLWQNKSQFTTFYDRFYVRIVQENLSDKTKQRKFHFKKFQTSAMKNDNFVRKRQRQALWGFTLFYGTDNRVVITKF